MGGHLPYRRLLVLLRGAGILHLNNLGARLDDPTGVLRESYPPSASETNKPCRAARGCGCYHRRRFGLLGRRPSMSPLLTLICGIRRVCQNWATKELSTCCRGDEAFATSKDTPMCTAPSRQSRPAKSRPIGSTSERRVAQRPRNFSNLDLTGWPMWRPVSLSEMEVRLCHRGRLPAAFLLSHGFP